MQRKIFIGDGTKDYNNMEEDQLLKNNTQQDMKISD